MAETTSWVRIIATPPGEAPLWVREQWVGLELPLIEPQPRTFHSFGVISRPRSYVYQLWAIYRGRSERILGYAVVAHVAVDILETANQAAAKWWSVKPSVASRARRHNRMAGTIVPAISSFLIRDVPPGAKT